MNWVRVKEQFSKVTFLMVERQIFELLKLALLMTAFSKTKSPSMSQVICFPLKPAGLAAMAAAVMFTVIKSVLRAMKRPPVIGTVFWFTKFLPNQLNESNQSA
jgi:hypothetical protein